MNRIEELKALAELHDSGALTHEEFQSEKDRLLNQEMAVQKANDSASKTAENGIQNDDVAAGTERPVSGGFTPQLFATPLGICTSLAILSMFLPWIPNANGWDTVSAFKLMDSSLIYTVYLFPLAAGMILWKHLNGGRAHTIWFAAGLIPAVLPWVMVSGMTPKGAPKSFDLLVDLVFKMWLGHASIGYLLAATSGVVLVCLSRSKSTLQTPTETPMPTATQDSEHGAPAVPTSSTAHRLIGFGMAALCGAPLFEWMTHKSSLHGEGSTSAGIGDFNSSFSVAGPDITLSGLDHWTGQMGVCCGILGLFLIYRKSSYLKHAVIVTVLFAIGTLFYWIPEASLMTGEHQFSGSFGHDYGGVQASATIKSWFEPALGAWIFGFAALYNLCCLGIRQRSVTSQSETVSTVPSSGGLSAVNIALGLVAGLLGPLSILMLFQTIRLGKYDAALVPGLCVIVAILAAVTLRKRHRAQ